MSRTSGRAYADKRRARNDLTPPEREGGTERPATIPAAMLALNRVVGNRAMTAMLQRNRVQDLVAMHERLILEATPQQQPPRVNRGRRAPAVVPNVAAAPAPAVVPTVNGGQAAAAANAVVLPDPAPATIDPAPAAESGGLAEALRNRGAALGNRAAPEAPKPPKEYASSTEGIEVENPVPYQLLLQSSKAQGVMAWVEDDKGEKLAEFTTDMGTNPYTIENRTTPCESANVEGIAARRRALQMLASYISAAAEAAPTGLDPAATHKPGDEQKWHTTSPDKGTAVKAGSEGDLKLIIKQPSHRVVPKSRGAVPGVQITQGVAFRELLEAAPQATGGFAHAQWLKEYSFYFTHYVAKYVPVAIPLVIPDEAKVFGMLGSLLHFYLRRLDFNAQASAGSNTWTAKEGVGGKAVMDDNEIAFPDMTHPPVKNAWGLLPKTPPAKWLVELDPAAQTRVKQALRDVPTTVTGDNQVNATAWKEVYQTVVFQGQMIAGHAVPDFRIAGQTGFAFEIRTPKKEEKSGYGY